METSAAPLDGPPIVTANAYLGAAPIVEVPAQAILSSPARGRPLPLSRATDSSL